MKRIKFNAALAFAFFVSIAGHASDEIQGVSSQHPAPSPSGKEIIFVADFDGQDRLWITGLDGTTLRMISTNSSADLWPVWSPDNRYIAFEALTGGVSDIWLVQADGRYPQKLTANGANNRQPTWSPDGKKIAFVSDKQGSNDIWIMNVDGTQQIQVIALPGQENHPSFSPTGDQLVFSESVGDFSNLMIVNINGTGLKTITSGSFSDWDPDWSASGIIFSSNRDSSSPRWKLWEVQLDGSALRRINNVVGLDPRRMKDGRIVFTDESVISRALSTISILNPATGLKQVVVDVQGYGIPVDIRPRKPTNRINPQSKGRVEVAILSTKTFDATKLINQSTLTFGRTGDGKSLTRCSAKFTDVNSDGLPDLRCRFSMSNTNFQPSSTTGVLRFYSLNGTPYEGRDMITIVSEDDPDDFKGDD